MKSSSLWSAPLGIVPHIYAPKENFNVLKVRHASKSFRYTGLELVTKRAELSHDWEDPQQVVAVVAAATKGAGPVESPPPVDFDKSQLAPSDGTLGR